jgi:hypothetical protein
MVGCRSRELYSEESIQFAGEFSHELWASIREHGSWEAMVSPNLFEINPSGPYGVNRGMSGYEVCPLPDAVYDIHDRVVAMRVRELHYEVNTNLVPPLLWSLGGV